VKPVCILCTPTTPRDILCGDCARSIFKAKLTRCLKCRSVMERGAVCLECGA
jgi:hypothetical protein